MVGNPWLITLLYWRVGSNRNMISRTCVTGDWLPVCLFVCLIMFNATFNNISVISWRSVLLVEETRVPPENQVPSWRMSLTNFIILCCTPRPDRDSNSTSVVIYTDCIDSCKSNYHMMTATTVPPRIGKLQEVESS